MPKLERNICNKQSSQFSLSLSFLLRSSSLIYLHQTTSSALIQPSSSYYIYLLAATCLLVSRISDSNCIERSNKSPRLCERIFLSLSIRRKTDWAINMIIICGRTHKWWTLIYLRRFSIWTDVEVVSSGSLVRLCYWRWPLKNSKAASTSIESSASTFAAN